MKSFFQYILEQTEREKVWRLDSSSVSEFHPQPYGMKKDGSSNRGEAKDGSRPFRGVYAAKNIEQIAPYALVGKKGKTEEVPWVAIHPRGKKPILHIVRSDFERDHPPVHLSEFSASEFVPRKKLTRNLWGSHSTDEGDDEYIATKSVKPARTNRITNVQDFIQKHMNVKFVNSHDELNAVHKQYGENFDGDVIVNG